MDFTQQIGTSWKSIAVTGPERSGTNIAATMIAETLGYRYVPESAWGSDFSKLWAMLNEANQRFVVHAPHLTYRVHEIDARTDGEVLVVFMIRAVDEIVASQRRISWGELTGLATDGEDPMGWGNPDSEWFDRPSSEEFSDLIDPNRHLCENRQIVWRKRQRGKVRDYFEVAYESLKSHSLWIDKERRRDFSSHQTKRLG